MSMLDILHVNAWSEVPGCVCFNFRSSFDLYEDCKLPVFHLCQNCFFFNFYVNSL